MSRGGRGGSRGNSKAILDSLGIEKGDVLHERIQAPSETFPPLLFPPPKPKDQEDSRDKYALMVKKELREYFSNSQYNIQIKKPLIKTVEHYSDKYLLLMNVSKPLEMDWNRVPKELRPATRTVGVKRIIKSTKIVVKPNLKKTKIKDESIKEKLEELEKRELKGGSDEEEVGEDQEEVLEEVEEEVDEEMDEGTDYYNTYFDNGEDGDDDDGMDDEGVM